MRRVRRAGGLPHGCWLPGQAARARQLSFPQVGYEEEQCHRSRSWPALPSREGKAGQYLAALAPLLEQARKEPGTLLYAVHRSADDPQVFWTTEIYADDAAFAAIARPRCMPLPSRCSLS
jgi:hypothetical protein